MSALNDLSIFRFLFVSEKNEAKLEVLEEPKNQFIYERKHFTEYRKSK